MKTVRFLCLLAVAALLVPLAGCSDDDTAFAPGTTAADDFANLDLNAPFGGLTETDEEIAFDDAGLKAMLLMEEGDALEDPVARDPLVLEMEERSRHRERHRDGELADFTYARLTWGMLRGPDDTTRVEGPCEVTDWTGTLRVDRGALVVRRTIRFEFPADHVVFPRLDRQTVAFVSHTGCHFDGLLIQIVEPPLAEGEEEPATPNTLRIETAAFSAEIPVADLAGMERVVDVDDAGNRFAVTGFKLRDIEICPKGFLSGRYRTRGEDRPDTVRGDDGEVRAVRHGQFAGAWYTLHGRIHGFMRGGYGVDAEGARVFVGKFIDRHGRFKGLIRGGWEPAADGRLARFRGEWVARGGGVEGVLGGEAHPVAGYPGGFYAGRWTTTCDEEATVEVLE
jgi:hypothetical protein